MCFTPDKSAGAFHICNWIETVVARCQDRFEAGGTLIKVAPLLALQTTSLTLRGVAHPRASKDAGQCGAF